MAAEFKLKQHLRLSPNAQIRNLVPENLTDVPPEEEWKLGRVWFNTSIGRLQGIFLKVDIETGIPLDPEEMEVRVIGLDALGAPRDGQFWPDGLFDFTEQTKISDAMDDVNEALKDLAPATATMLRGDLELTGQSFITGRVSKQDSTNPITVDLNGLTAGTEIDYIIKNSSVNATLPTEGIVVKGEQQQQFGKADNGVMVAVIDGVNSDTGLNLLELFNEPSRDYYGTVQGFVPEISQTVFDYEGTEVTFDANPNKESYKSESGTLTVNTVERYNDFKKWQRGTGEVAFDVTPGKHSAKVEHTVETNLYSTNQMDVFYDPNQTKPKVTINNFNIETGTIKYVSGIPYYSQGISFTMDVEATNVFNNTYWDNPVSLVMSGSNHSTLPWNFSESSLGTSDVPLYSDVWTLNSYTISYNSPNTITDSIKLSAKAGKPTTGWGTTTSNTKAILIDTYPETGNSTPLKETFLDEEYRIRPSVVDLDDLQQTIDNTKGSWNSNIELSAGEAHQYKGVLVKAQDNLDGYHDITTDYTALADQDQMYYRRFYTPDEKPNSNGILKITTNGIIDTDFDLFIKLPGVTGWLDTKELFDLEIFLSNYTVDGTACATMITKTSTGYEIPWSVGNLSTYDSGYGYVIKVVLKTSTVNIDTIEEISENWR